MTKTNLLGKKSGRRRKYGSKVKASKKGRKSRGLHIFGS